MSVTFKADDLESLNAMFENHPGQIACVISEPEKLNAISPDHLQKAIDIAHKHGALYIIDEMITGFKTGFPGSMTKYKVVPDMATWGKGIANGFSFCALTGKKEVMELGGIRRKGKEKLFLVSTTHGGETHAIAAGLATIDEFEKKNVGAHTQKIGQDFIDRSSKLITEKGLREYIDNLQFNWHPSLGFRNSRKEPDFFMRTLFNQEMIKRGVLFQGIFCPSFSHTTAEVDLVINAMEGTLDVYKKALDEGHEKYLVGEPIKPVFRKYI